MRLSSKKAAYVVVNQSSVVGNPEFARDDKGRAALSWGNSLVAERAADPSAALPWEVSCS
jgi:hypothetical protein